MSDFSFEANGKRYYLSPLRLHDLTDRLASWLSYKPYFDFEKAMKGKIPDDVYQKMASECLTKCFNNPIKPDADDFGSIQKTPTAQTQLVFYSLKRNHKDITEEEVQDLCTTTQSENIIKLMWACSGVDINAIEEEQLKKKAEIQETLLTSIKTLQENTDTPPIQSAT